MEVPSALKLFLVVAVSTRWANTASRGVPKHSHMDEDGLQYLESGKTGRPSLLRASPSTDLNIINSAPNTAFHTISVAEHVPERTVLEHTHTVPHHTHTVPHLTHAVPHHTITVPHHIGTVPVNAGNVSAGVAPESASSSDTTDPEGRYCGACIASAPQKADLTAALPALLPILGDLKTLGLAIPILVLQIITLSIVAYLLKWHKKEEEEGPLYYAYPAQGGSYQDSYSGYRSLHSKGSTMSWVLEKLSEAIELYQEYEKKKDTED